MPVVLSKFARPATVTGSRSIINATLQRRFGTNTNSQTLLNSFKTATVATSSTSISSSKNSIVNNSSGPGSVFNKTDYVTSLYSRAFSTEAATATETETVSTVGTWPSRSVFHDQAVLTVFGAVCQILQIPKPIEETRRIGDEFVHQVKLDGLLLSSNAAGNSTTSGSSESSIFEARGRNKRAARREAIRRLLEAVAPELSIVARNEISFKACQQLVLSHSKTGASSINVKYDIIEAENNLTQATVSFEEFEAIGKGQCELSARVAAFDQLINMLETDGNLQSTNDMSSSAILGGSLGSGGGNSSNKSSGTTSSHALRSSMMIGRHNTVAQRLRQNTDFHYEPVKEGQMITVTTRVPASSVTTGTEEGSETVTSNETTTDADGNPIQSENPTSESDTVLQELQIPVPAGHNFQCTVVWSDGEFAEGTGRSKNAAKARACEEMLVKREIIERSLTPEEYEMCDNPEAHGGAAILEKLPPSSWELFLPQMWKEKANECLPYLVGRNADMGYMPVGLWEQLISDTAARGANDWCNLSLGGGGGDSAGFAEDQFIEAKKQEIRDLCRVKVEGEFLSEGGASYFHKWRGHIGVEEHAMFESGKELMEDIGPLTVVSLDQWPSIKIEGVSCEFLHVDDLLLVRGRPCRVTSLKKGNEGGNGIGSAQLKLLDPREDDIELFKSGLNNNSETTESSESNTNSTDLSNNSSSEEVYAVQFGMAVPNERMVRALKSFSGYNPPEYENMQPVAVSEWLQDILVNPLGIGFGSEFDHTSKIAEPVPPLESIPLSDSQKVALEAATSRRLTLIQGPPGTGKTYCGAAIACSYIAQNPQARVLACADSNIAADNLCMKIQALMPDARVIRVGDGGSEELRNQVLENENQNNVASSGYNAKELRLLRMEAMRRQLPQAQVVVATCIGSGMEIMDQAGSYDFCVVDEASQALEPATLVALERAGPEVKHVVLIGDHKQLPATVLSNDAQIGVSLFQRLADKGVDPLMLLEQRRMHSLIAEFPNECFYNGRLINATDDSLLENIQPGTKSNVELVHVAPRDINGNEVKRGESTCNEAEAEALCTFLEQFVDREDLTIGVLTPYAAQKSLLSNMLFNMGLLRDHIRVDTIDGFQGMEKDLIVFSATRSNPRGDLGFLKDPRRMNVMLTRAKKSLVVFADATCLRSSFAGHWGRWVQWVQNRGAVSGDELPSAMSSDWSGRKREEPVDFASAFGSSDSSTSATDPNSSSEDSESDFLKMLRANEKGTQASFHSGSVHLDQLPGSNANRTHSSLKFNVNEPEPSESKIGRQAKKDDDLSSRTTMLSDEEFNRLLEDDSNTSFGGHGSENKSSPHPTQDQEFLAMLDRAAGKA